MKRLTGSCLGFPGDGYGIDPVNLHDGLMSLDLIHNTGVKGDFDFLREGLMALELAEKKQWPRTCSATTTHVQVQAITVRPKGVCASQVITGLPGLLTKPNLCNRV